MLPQEQQQQQADESGTAPLLSPRPAPRAPHSIAMVDGSPGAGGSPARPPYPPGTMSKIDLQRRLLRIGAIAIGLSYVVWRVYIAI